MIAKTYNITIWGYYLDVDKDSVPNHSGVYFVYECTYNKEKDTVSIHKLIYIGESDEVRDRIADHEKYEKWKKHVRPGNILCYSTCQVAASDRERIEAAYIFEHQPPVNTEHKASFDFDQTTVNSNGKTALLATSFTLNQGIILG